MEAIDQSLLPYLHSVNEGNAQDCLEHILEVIARPIIQPIVQRAFQNEFTDYRYQAASQTADDVTNDVLVKLLTRLRTFKTDPVQNPISNFPGLVAVTAYRILTDLRRDNNRQRTNLEKQIRRLFATSQNLKIWKDEQGDSICGYAAWDQRIESAGFKRIYATRAALFAALDELRVGKGDPNTADLILFSLNRIGRAARLNDLTGVLVSFRATRTSTIQVDEALRARPELALADVQAGPLTSLEMRRLLDALFQELQKLNLIQRKSLLLNMTDCYGFGIEWFVFTGIASEDQLANLLDLSVEEFRRLLDHLPMTDNQISELLGIDSAKIANIRKAVRDRLKRRRRAFVIEKTE